MCQDVERAAYGSSPIRTTQKPQGRKRKRWDMAVVGAIALVRGSSIVKADTPIIAISLPNTIPPTQMVETVTENGGGPGMYGYVASSQAMESVMRLAVDDINSDLGSTWWVDANLSLTVIQASSTTAALQGLCTVLSNKTMNGTFGVIGPPLSSQAALLESVSTNYWGLPVVTPLAAAAHGAVLESSVDDDGATNPLSFLMGVQPDIFAQMRALVTLILQMKGMRDAHFGRSYNSERVFILNTDDAYGSTAAGAFQRAADDIAWYGEGILGIDDFPTSTAVDVAGTLAISSRAASNVTLVLEALAEAEASIIVLLAEGHDGRLIRTIFSEARELGLVNDRVQWYLPDAATVDGLFAVNETHRDAQLAYDMRGTLGVRPCPPTEGPGAEAFSALTSRWASLDTEVYPGSGTLTADGQMDFWLSFAYDSVVTLATAIRATQEVVGGTSFDGLSVEGCPFSTRGPWANGGSLQSAILATDFVGVTGPLSMTVEPGTTNSFGEELASGWRASNGTNFCTVNLQEDESLGAAFVSIMTWAPDGANASEGFQAPNGFTRGQTFPSGGDMYPSDRPTLRGMHLEVTTEDGAKPFVFVTGEEREVGDYQGIVMEYLYELSLQLGFTYNVTPFFNTTTNDEVDLVARREFDMSATWATITEERMESVSFSYPYYDVGVAFVYKRSEETGVSWLKAFRPFEPSLWGMLFILLVLVILLQWMYEGAKNDAFAGREQGPSGRYRRELSKGMARSTYVTMSLMLGQLTHKPETVEGYILTSGWLFTCFILAASFTAELASFLTTERQSSVGISVDDLKAGTILHSDVALLQGGSLQSFYEREIMQCESSMCSSANDTPQGCSSMEDCFNMVQSGDAVLTIMDSATAEYEVLTEYCDLDVLPDTFFAQHYGLVLPKDSPLLEELDQATLSLREDGTLQAMASKYLSDTSCSETTYGTSWDAEDENLSVADLAGVFLVLGVVMMMTFIMWLCRRSPVAKSLRRSSSSSRRKLLISNGDEEENVSGLHEDMTSMSKKQRQSLAFEAMVELLAASRKERKGNPTAAVAPAPGGDEELKTDEVHEDGRSSPRVGDHEGLGAATPKVFSEDSCDTQRRSRSFASCAASRSNSGGYKSRDEHDGDQSDGVEGLSSGRERRGGIRRQLSSIRRSKSNISRPVSSENWSNIFGSSDDDGDPGFEHSNLRMFGEVGASRPRPSSDEHDQAALVLNDAEMEKDPSESSDRNRSRSL